MTAKAATSRADDRLAAIGVEVLRVVSRRIAARLRGQVDASELFALGNAALYGVVRTFDPARGSFEAYASLKLKWAIFDGLRQQRAGRSSPYERALAASERVADAYAAGSGPASPEPSELPTEEGFGEALAGLLGAHAAAMATAIVTTEPIDESTSPDDKAARGQFRAALRVAMQRLPERERALVERHHFDGESLDGVARELGISKSWASRLHAQAMASLARALKEHR